MVDGSLSRTEEGDMAAVRASQEGMCIYFPRRARPDALSTYDDED